MCYAKPGPRCASHLASDIKKIDKELVALEDKWDGTWSKDVAEKESERRILKFAYDGTRTGQNKIVAALNKMGKDHPDHAKLEEYRLKTLAYYTKQKAKFKQAEDFRKMREAATARRALQ